MDAAAEKLRSLEHQVSNTPSGMSFSHFGGNKYLKLRSEGYQNAGVAMHRTEPDGRVTRVWVGVHGMILWPRTECEAGVERAEKADLEREVKHWKANHATEVRRARILKERTDMPMERTAAYEQWGNDLAELERLKSLRFPQSLRKMWSGSEVQRWLEENLK